MEEENDIYQPPSEVEMKIIQTRRERSDKISKLMAQYLLKGYKMLSSSCESCGTILLQDRQQQFYCIGCSEVDNEHSKDNPALSGSAARRQIEEFEHRTIHADSSSVATLISNNETGARKLPDEKLKETHKEKTHSIPSNYWISESENVLKETMMWVTESLRSSRNVDCCIQYCTLIKSCADALVSLKRTRDFKFN